MLSVIILISLKIFVSPFSKAFKLTDKGSIWKRFLEFLKEFRKKLSEYLDKDITKLNDAKSLVKKSEATYQRSI